MVNVHDSVLPLRSNRRFQLLWTGSAAASLAARLADTAYPLLLLQLTGSPTAAGAFGAVGLGATLLCGLHGGAVADRRDRRRVLLAADAVRFLTAASLAVALIAHQLTLPHALVAAAVTGAAAAYGGPVRTLAIRAVVPPAQLGQALAREELRGSTAALLGPPLAGLLLAAGQALPAMAIAFGSLLAVLATCLVRFDGRRVVGAVAEGEGEVGGVDFPGSDGSPTTCAGRLADQVGRREGGGRSAAPTSDVTPPRRHHTASSWASKERTGKSAPSTYSSISSQATVELTPKSTPPTSHATPPK